MSGVVTEEPGILYARADGESMQRQLADIDLAKRLSETLQRHYPGHSWGVNANTQGGIATIQNFALSGQWGFVLHLAHYSASELDQRVVMAAGELLERYNIRRGRFRQDDYAGLQYDAAGNARPV